MNNQTLDRIALDRELVKRGGLRKFVSLSWGLIEPVALVSNWHIDVISEALQACFDREIKKLIINIPPGCMKPIDDEARVLLGTGQRVALKDVRKGDIVVSHTGRGCRVSDVTIQGELPTLLITTFNGRTIRAAHDHPFLTPDGWVEAKRLQVGNVLGCVIPQDRAPSAHPLEEFRLLGYFIGDGCCTKGTTSLRADITCLDPLQGEDILHCARALGFTATFRDGKRYDFSKGVRPWLIATHIAGKGSWTKRVPEFVFESSNEQIAHLIGAYFACDGTLTRRAPSRADLQILFSSVNRPLLEDVQHLLLRLGIRSRIRTRHQKYNAFAKGPYTSCVLVLTSQDDTSKFIQRIPVFGQKALRLANWGVQRTAFDTSILPDPIVSIEDGGTVPCRCLSVDDDHSFTAEDLVVHNSRLAATFYPAWCWAEDPTECFLYASFDQGLSDRDARSMRDIVASDWFQLRWPAAKLPRMAVRQVRDFRNATGGWRFSTSVGGKGTGRHPHERIIDDPLKPADTVGGADTTRKALDACLMWYRNTISTRQADPVNTVDILIMQRLHDADLAGMLAAEWANEPGFCNLVLPMRYESDRAFSFSWERAT